MGKLGSTWEKVRAFVLYMLLTTSESWRSGGGEGVRLPSELRGEEARDVDSEDNSLDSGLPPGDSELVMTAVWRWCGAPGGKARGVVVVAAGRNHNNKGGRDGRCLLRQRHFSACCEWACGVANGSRCARLRCTRRDARRGRRRGGGRQWW